MNPLIFFLGSTVLVYKVLIKYKTKTEADEWGQLSGTVKFLVGVFAVVKFLVSGYDTTITAVVDQDGGHDPNGKHPIGRAVDLRDRELTSAQIETILEWMRPFVSHFGGVIIKEDTHIHMQV